MRDHAASPIDERAECIEDQGANSVHGSRPFPIGLPRADICLSRILLEGKGNPAAHASRDLQLDQATPALKAADSAYSLASYVMSA
jgi:hypothetical protein